MSAWKARLAVFCVFAAGFLCGAASLHLYRLRAENQIFHSPDPAAQIIAIKLDRELDLTEAQKREVYQAVIGSRTELLGLTREIAPQMMAVFEHAQERIRKSLDARQQEKFDRIVQERRKIFRQILDQNKSQASHEH